MSQNRPAAQGNPAMPPHIAPSPPPPVGPQAPAWSSGTRAARRTQSLAYVWRSQPQTGLYSRVQAVGVSSQTPGTSAQPQVPAGGIQNRSRRQTRWGGGVKPPHDSPGPTSMI